MPEQVPSPQYIPQAEQLLGVPFFPDQERSDLLYNGDIETLNETSELGLREFAYRACLRTIAEYRYQERNNENENKERHLTDQEYLQRQVAEAAIHNAERLYPLSRQLAIAAKAERVANELKNGGEIDEREEYVVDILSSLAKKPEQMRVRDAEYKPIEHTMHGAVAVAPTGFGKTGIMAQTAEKLGVGQPLKGAPDEKSLRALIVTPSQTIVNQTIDPNGSFRQYGPENASIGAYYQHEKTADTDIVVTTIDSFVDSFTENRLNGEGRPFDLLMVDEVHHITGSEFLQKLVQEKWQGTTLGFSATPNYRAGKDARNVIPNPIEHYDMAKSIEAGLLNQAQIYLFSLNIEDCENILAERGLLLDELDIKEMARYGLDEHVVDFIEPLISEGRRGIVFCEAGNKSDYAKRLAQRLSQLEHPDGSSVNAQAASSFHANESEALEAYKRGEIDILTTVDMGREGYDAEVDFVVVNCVTRSQLRMAQIVGRGTRVSEQFPTTIYGQFINPLADLMEKQASIHEAFGLKGVLEQGYTLRSKDNAETTSHYNKEQSSRSHYLPLPEHLVEIAQRIEGHRFGEIFIGAERGKRYVPEEYISLEAMIADYSVSPAQVKTHLREAGYEWKGHFTEVEGEKKLIHYYSPEAQHYIEATFAQTGSMMPRELATELNVSEKTLEWFAKKAGVEKKTALSQKGWSSKQYNPEDVIKLRNMVANLPVASEEDMSFPRLAQEIGISSDTLQDLASEKGIEPELHLSEKGIVSVIPRGKVEELREAYNEIPHAQKGDMTITQLAAAIGTHYQLVDRYLTPEDYQRSLERRIPDARGSVRTKTVWPEHVAQEIIERLEKFKPRNIPSHLVPTSAIKKFVSNVEKYTSDELKEELQQAGFSIEEILVVGSRSFSHFVSWDGIRYLQEKLGPRKGGIKLNFHQLPSADDQDQAKDVYARSIQLQILPAKKLGIVSVPKPEKSSKVQFEKNEQEISPGLYEKIKQHYPKPAHQKKVLENIELLRNNNVLELGNTQTPPQESQQKFHEAMLRTKRYDPESGLYFRPTTALMHNVEGREIPALMHFFGLDKLLYERQLSPAEVTHILGPMSKGDITSYINSIFEKIRSTTKGTTKKDSE